MENQAAPAWILERIENSTDTYSTQRDYEKELVEQFNERAGDMKDYDCPVCKNKGMIARLEDDKCKILSCGCLRARASMRRIRNSGLSELMQDYTFDNFVVESDWQREAKRLAMDYVDGEGWFIACGCVGAGKTHLCTAICGELLKKGLDVIYMPWREESTRIKAVVTDDELYCEAVDPLKRCSCLYIDDLFKKSSTDADIRLAFEILNHRYNNRRQKTIISTELTMNQLLAVDEAIGSRIYQRTKEFCLEFGKGKNWRMK